MGSVGIHCLVEAGLQMAIHARFEPIDYSRFPENQLSLQQTGYRISINCQLVTIMPAVIPVELYLAASVALMNGPP